MSWIQKLYETYERCIGHEPDPTHRLMPVSHTTQQVQIEIVLDSVGVFRRARVLDKSESTTLIPCTERSGGRSGKAPINHPLCDKLQYLAADFIAFGGEVTTGFAAEPLLPHRNYLHDLKQWVVSVHSHPKIDAILAYVNNGHLIQDLVSAEVLQLDDRGRLKTSWDGDKNSTPAIFKALSAKQTQADAFVRWSVETAGEAASGTWQDPALIAAWIAYCRSMQTKIGYCLVTGRETALAVQHPAKLRHGGDKAKLISANDSTGYTFRGRFLDADEAAGVSSEVTQKAHSALRWLINSGHGYHTVSTTAINRPATSTPERNSRRGACRRVAWAASSSASNSKPLSIGRMMAAIPADFLFQLGCIGQSSFERPCAPPRHAALQLHPCRPGRRARGLRKVET